MLGNNAVTPAPGASNVASNPMYAALAPMITQMANKYMDQGVEKAKEILPPEVMNNPIAQQIMNNKDMQGMVKNVVNNGLNSLIQGNGQNAAIADMFNGMLKQGMSSFMGG